MLEATDKVADKAAVGESGITDDRVMRFVAVMFRPALEAMTQANGAAAYWQSRYDDAAARLVRAEAELERREELLDRLDPVAWNICEAAGIPRDPMAGCWEGVYLLAGDAGAGVVAGLARGRAAEAERDRQWHDALWKALPEMPRGAGDKHAPDSPETVEWCIGAVLADVQADLARVVAERDAAREEAAKLRGLVQAYAAAEQAYENVEDEEKKLRPDDWEGMTELRMNAHRAAREAMQALFAAVESERGPA